ncbi:hypothetical protein DH2020_022865 [Rehmannia glutinosa]|uniref:QWRF motif-containing protein n=1 Tax=Rehmannia glutinosa TaxID=99300 RepID=A0ABR0W4F5_REHGL
MGGATAVSDHSSKPKKPKSREVSSRFLSPTSSSTTSSSTEYGNQSPNSTLISSPKQKPKSSTGRSRKHKSYENSGFFRGLWPSSSIPSPSSNSKLDTLANHLGHDRLKDLEERKNNKLKSDQNSFPLSRQKSCTEFSRFENEKKIYAGGLLLSDTDDTRDSESEYSDVYSAARVSTLGGRKRFSGVIYGPNGEFEKTWDQVPSKFMHDLSSRLMQWRYSNARAEAVNGNVIKQAESSFVNVWNGLIELRHSALQKKLQLQKEKLDLKLNYILHSQIKALENWGNMERQHVSGVCTTIDYLHSVVCRVPLVDGAKVESQSASIAVRHASDLAASIHLMLTTFSPTIEETVGVLAELAMTVTQEKLLLQECFDLFRNISIMEIEERSLRSSIMQLKLLQQHHHQQQYILA